jgi:hypothetical protein
VFLVHRRELSIFYLVPRLLRISCDEVCVVFLFDEDDPIFFVLLSFFVCLFVKVL